MAVFYLCFFILLELLLQRILQSITIIALKLNPKKINTMKVIRKSVALPKVLNLSFQKQNMIYKDYNWTTKYDKKDPRIKGEPDETIFSRREGKEMLYFINKCAGKWGWSHDNFAKKRLEKIIREIVPLSIQSQIEVYNWIQENCQTI